VADRPKGQDRKAVLDELKRKQRAVRRRGFLVVGVCAVVAATILGLAGYHAYQDHQDKKAFAALPLDGIGAPLSSCGEVTSQKTDGSHEHVSPKTQVTYATAPPAYGAHWSYPNLAPAAFERKFYSADDRPELEALVHNLEHGYTVLWYDESVADSDQLEDIKAIADKFEADSYNPLLKFIAAPWTAADEKESGTFPDGMHVALSHWSAGGSGETDAAEERGVFQYCSEPSGAAVKQFMIDYPYTDSTEPNAP
jgi:hypothetical protein